MGVVVAPRNRDLAAPRTRCATASAMTGSPRVIGRTDPNDRVVSQLRCVSSLIRKFCQSTLDPFYL